MSKNIIVAEDEAAIREFVVINLERSGYTVFEAENGQQAIDLYESHNGDFPIAILDLMMPLVDGFEVCKQLRKRNSQMGIIMLTAKSQEMDKVRGLMIGADDYITKPFSPSELVARVDALYRRVAQNTVVAPIADKMIQGPFELDTKKRTLTKNGEYVELTHVEYQIMEYLLKHTNQAISRTELLGRVWGEAYFGEEKIVDVNIRRLRMKIEDDPSNPKFIQTVWGYGYKWDANI